MTLEQFSMTLDEFRQLDKCPSYLSTALQALWYAKRGDWATAHLMVQNANDCDSAWVHGYLHRREGDLDNARFWYRRCAKPEFSGDLPQEWEYIASELLKNAVIEHRTLTFSG